MKITNTQPGPRGVNTVNGPVLVEPGETVEVDIFEREKEHLEAAAWFKVEGSYTSNGKTAGSSDLKAAATDASAEIADLKRQLAEKDAELAALKADEPDRDELKKQADELGIEYPSNVKTAKLKELIDAKLAE
jgi:hypothetical protein